MDETAGFELLLKTLESGLDDCEDREDLADRLEDAIAECDKRMDECQNDDTLEPLVADSVYDTMKEYLGVLRPNAVQHIWSEDHEAIDADTDKFLVQRPMKSIDTIKSMSDPKLLAFRDRIPISGTQLLVSVKENGHGTRVALQYGDLKKAHTRGRSTNGRDITRHFKRIIGEQFEGAKEFPLVEIRGEVVLPYRNLESARRFNKKIKNAFTGVASMIKPSATDEEIDLLHFVAYDIYIEGKEFENLSDKFNFLEELGFETPTAFMIDVNKDNFFDVMTYVLKRMEELTEEYEYFSDGVVVAIDNLKQFEICGEDEHARLGNVALKMEKWKQDGYEGCVDHIEWCKGKSKRTPVAILEEPVLTASGNSVSRVPLYAPCYVLMLEAYFKGKVINFKYGGEAGVIPCTADGKLITDKTAFE